MGLTALLTFIAIALTIFGTVLALSLSLSNENGRNWLPLLSYWAMGVVMPVCIGLAIGKAKLYPWLVRVLFSSSGILFVIYWPFHWPIRFS